MRRARDAALAASACATAWLVVGCPWPTALRGDPSDVPGDGSLDGADGGDHADVGSDGPGPADAEDGRVEAADACDDRPAAPRLLSPANGALTGSVWAGDLPTLRPRLRWLHDGTDECGISTFDVEIDDSCAVSDFASCAFPSPETRETGLVGHEWSPPADLPVARDPPVGRRYWWRVRACRPGRCSEWSAVRCLDVGRTPLDVNGDGYSDLVVGEPQFDGVETQEGRVYVYAGGRDGVGASSSSVIAAPAPTFWGRFGVWLAAAGDLDADGFADLAIGSYGEGRAGSTTDKQGRVDIFLGGEDGLGSTPDIVLESPGSDPANWFGERVAGAGDVDADGHADLIVGASGQDSREYPGGATFLYFGGPAGVAPTPDQTLLNPLGDLRACFGSGVTGAGDTNVDGFADVVVGASCVQGRDDRRFVAGEAYGYLGTASGLAASPSVVIETPEHAGDAHFGEDMTPAGDPDDDGFGDAALGAPWLDGRVVGSPPDEYNGAAFLLPGGEGGIPSTPGTTLRNPEGPFNSAYGLSLSAGDLDGDGHDDLAVGSPWWDEEGGMPRAGRVYVHRGGPDGIGETADVVLDSPVEEPFGEFGFAVSALLDLNGDGRADLAVGARGHDGVATREGKVHVYLGTALGVGSSPTMVLDSPEPQELAEFGWSLPIGMPSAR